MTIFFKCKFLPILLACFFLVINHSKANTIKDKKNKEKINNNKAKRKIANEEYNYHPMKLYYDMISFDASFPSKYSSIRNNFIEAMNKAANLLSKLVNVDRKDHTFNNPYVNITANGISNWNQNLLTNGKTTVGFEEYDYYVLFKFTNQITEVAYTKILGKNDDIAGCGYMAFNTNKDKSTYTIDFLTKLMMHNLIHLIGFYYNEKNDALSNTMYSHYYIDHWQEDTNPIVKNVVQYAKKFFYGDPPPYVQFVDTLYLELDENNMIHWNKRRLKGELMTKFDYTDELIISNLTLSFLDGIPTLKTNHYTGGLMVFGKGKGREFLYKYCGDEMIIYNATFSNEFYLPKTKSFSAEPSCSSRRLIKTIYKINPTDNIDIQENKFNCISNSGTGHRGTDFPPEAHLNDEPEPTGNDENYLYTGPCYDPNTHADEKLHEEVGLSNSFCVLSSLFDQNSGYSTPKVRAVCHQMFCSSKSLTIKINNDYIVCPKTGGKIEVEGYQGYLLCPDYNIICTGTVMCNNFIDCIEKKSEEKSDALKKINNIRTTQYSHVYTEENPLDYYENNGELSDKGDSKCSYGTLKCTGDRISIKCGNHFYLDEETHTCKQINPYCDGYKDPKSNNCSSCITSYNFVLEEDNMIKCKHKDDLDNYYYYYDRELGDSIYRRCNLTFPYCSSCRSNGCTECEDSYQLIDRQGSYGKCASYGDYYYDGSMTKAKSCWRYELNPNCEKCYSEENNRKYIYICIQCKEGFAFYSDETDQNNCIEKSIKDPDNNKYYTDDNKMYYPCSNNINYCQKCLDKNTCSECDSTQSYLEEGNFCIEKSLVDVQKLYYKNSAQNNKYTSCEKILDKKCKRCTTNTACIECQDSNDVLVDNDSKCINKDSKLFYIDINDSNKKKSCINYTPFQNCLKCELSNTNNFNCLECKENHVFFHNDENSITCTDKTTLITNKYFIMDDKNYYSCDSSEQEVENCDECNTKNSCIKCKSGYTNINSNTKCLLISDINNKKYYEDPIGSTYYYLCSESLINCVTCDNKDKCNSCNDNYIIDADTNLCVDKALFDNKKYYLYDNSDSGKYKSCSTVSTNCEKCKSATECISCKAGLFLVKENDNTFNCKNIDNINQYYKIIEGDLEYYKKCNIENCDECNAANYCTKCNPNFVIIDDDYSKCEDLSTKKYYLDKTDSKYKLCSNGFLNCEKCINGEENNNEFKCIQCKTDYAFKYNNNNNFECVLNTILISDKTFYTNDTGINYYSCSSYNDILHCLECEEKESCKKCLPNYILENDGKICYSEDEVDKNLVVLDPNSGFHVFCKDTMIGCNTCTNTTTCDSCQSNLVSLDDNKCLPESELKDNNNYIQIPEENDENGGIKYISCSVAINNCITCTSNTECTKCDIGYFINDDKSCEKVEEIKQDDDNSSTGIIIGVVVGIFGFLIIAGLTGYYLFKKFLKPNLGQNDIRTSENEKENVNEIKDEEIDVNKKQDEIPDSEKQNGVFVYTKKRAIHN